MIDRARAFVSFDSNMCPRRNAARLTNGFSVHENVKQQLGTRAAARPDSFMFTSMLDDLDQMTKDLESCLSEESGNLSTCDMCIGIL